jgi:hypothetical protein
LNPFTQPDVKLFSASKVGGATNRPCHSEEEELTDLASEVVKLVVVD